MLDNFLNLEEEFLNGSDVILPTNVENSVDRACKELARLSRKKLPKEMTEISFTHKEKKKAWKI